MSGPLGIEAMRRERARLLVVRLVVAVYWLVIVEGALRKWFLPQFQQAIFFLRDPLVLAAIGVAVSNRLVPRSGMLMALFGLSICFAYLAAYHVLVLGVKPEVVAYGWRSYFLYAYLAVVVGHTFTRDDLMRIVRLTLWISIPMALLTVWQFRSPKDAFINRQLPGTEIFTVARGVVRTTGTFTFTAGMSLFVGGAAACFAIVYLGARARMGVLAIGASFIGVVTCLAVSGSRTAWMHSIIIAVALSAVELSRPFRQQRMRIYAQVLAVLGTVSILIIAGYSDALGLLYERMETASANGEKVSLRIVYYLLGGVFTDVDAPLAGYGLGYGTGGGSYLATGRSHFTLAEYEIDRVILECGPILGMAYMLGRWALALGLAREAFSCMRARRDHVPLMLVSFSGVLLMVGQITFQGTSNAFCWIFTGLTLAAIRTSKAEEAAAVAVAAPPPVAAAPDTAMPGAVR